MPRRYGYLWDQLTSFENLYVADPKPRLISAAPYRDRVVHHALCNVLEPIFERSFIFDSYACRKGKGTHAAVDRYTAFAGKNRYVLKCDVRKFFPSVDRSILVELLAAKVKDPDVLWLARLIIFVVLDNDKVRLAELRGQIEEFLWGLRLWLHPRKRTISRVEDGLRFLGYRVWPDHRWLDRRGVVRFCRRLRIYARLYRAGWLPAAKLTQRIGSWMGHACHADTWNLREDIFSRTMFLGPAADESCPSGRLLEQQAEQHPVCKPQRERSSQPQQQQRFSAGQHCPPPF